ncbi:Outer membrane protein assembly factor BamB [Paraburkholderia nemoris]|uniref:outer membrane protein assembly factor BamB family protein n=1 Tax=Paraburkholderia nemoris TaxID=2793076 RepID=UPI00190AFACB|nr:MULTISPECIES: PQQ-binding-like beta-propeller repeat protein [Paraburkholderia]MBK3786268.1 PQQ-binding-like beta-propeller repeat protein [Paraburkholderia aspalathi]CAE6850085.1 Outer membrane protein assembly factor BamB [Paraburkholderia nemoris]
MTSAPFHSRLAGLVAAVTFVISAGPGARAQTPAETAPVEDAPLLAPVAVSAATRAMTPGAALAPSFTATDWPTFGMNAQRTGNNPVETVLATSNVASLRTHWTTDLGGPMLTQPTLAAGVSINGVLTDVVYAATLQGDMFALNASTGATIWKQHVVPVHTTCSDFAASGGNIGFIGTPTIDRSRNQMYIVSGDGFLHAYNLATGADLPALHVMIPDPANVAPKTYVYGSPTLSVSTQFGTSLYLTTASTCDTTPYHGQVVRVSIPDGAILQRWYPDGASGPNGGGIWGPGGVSVVRGGSAVYALTGNAFANPQNAAFAEHVVALTSSLAVTASNSPMAPTTQDADFGATAPLFQPRGCPPMLAAFQKTGNLFIYDQATIQSGPTQTLNISQPRDSGTNIGLPAYDPVLKQLYMAAPSHSPTGFDNHGLLALGISSTCSVSLAWQQPVGKDSISDNPAISPVVANGVVYYADGIADQVFAVDAKSGQILWSTDSLPVAERPAGPILTSPTVVNGQLFVAGMDHKLRAFGL